MVNASKILTVSYGTFSCTLEGFDDPFSTMRSIAEYFRDLAADDRYFGAEPPTPDAEMLHRIAERENHRRVEARVEQNSVILRQVEDGAAGAEDDAAGTTHATSESGPPADNEAAPAPVVATAPDDRTPPADDEAYDEVDDSVAAKLARIRAAVARSRAEPEPLLNAIFAEDEHAEPVLEDASIATAFATDDLPVADDPQPRAPSSEPTYEEPSSEGSDLDLPVSEEQTLAPEEESELADEDVRDTAEWQPAGADGVLVSEPTVADALETPKTTAETEQAAPDLPDGGIASDNDDEATDDGSADIAAMLDEAVAGADQHEDDSDNAGSDQPVDIAAVLSAADNLAEDVPTEAEVQTDAQIEQDLSEEPATSREKDEPEDLPLDLSELLADDLADDTENESDDTNLILGDAESTDNAGNSAEAPREPSVRVLKLRREEFDAQFIQVDDTENESELEAQASAPSNPEPGDADDIRATLGETGLSAEEENDLIAELAEVELDNAPPAADSADIVTEQDGADEADEDAASARSPEAEVEQSPDDPAAEGEDEANDDAGVAASTGNEVSVTRLLERADTALEDGEGSRRRSAIAHLKAAVAAVRADGGQAKQASDAEAARAMNQFRDDLASVVRPIPADASKPQHSDGTAASTDSDARGPVSRPRRKMPPLMLVSEQRVDKKIETASEPVRPRRVQTRDLDQEIESNLFDQELPQSSSDSSSGNMFSDADDFKGYIAETGAEGIQELLEASLAFGLFVEGNKFNSRPQIMKRMLSQFPDGSVSREDGLRAFGVLLREGRIQRVKRGEFLLPESSRFHPGQAPTANSA